MHRCVNVLFVTTIRHSIRQRGGLAATFELYADGWTRKGLAVAVRRGTIIRVRQGWYAVAGLHPQLVAAARVGGRLACVSALSLRGAFSPPAFGLHVAVTPEACRLRAPDRARARLPRGGPTRVHWTLDDPPGRLAVPDLVAIEQLVSCQPRDVAAAVIATMLHEHPQLYRGFRTWARPLAWLEPVDGVCESGTEALLWFRMGRYRLPIRRQVKFVGLGRVDFLVGERLVIEVDGAEYHTSPEQFEEDRHRDAVLSARGYRVLRFSYQQVMYAWDEVEVAILAAVARADHY